MHALIVIAALTAAPLAIASRPANTTICEFYTNALFGGTSAADEQKLVAALVNTAMIGNFSKGDTTVTVPGILAQGQSYNGTPVNLAPYFDGALASTNRGGSVGVSINFLNDGGAAPLTEGKPSNGTTSNQYKLMTHLYSYFGILLGCSQVGQTGFSAYAGQTSMYTTHKFMALDAYEVGYFIQQVGLAAKSFGVANEDIEAVASALNNLFGYRCADKVDIVPKAAEELQSICIASDCLLAVKNTCSAYAAVESPKHANGSVTVSGTATATASDTSSVSATSTKKSGAEVTRKLCRSLLVLFALTTVSWLL